MGDTNRRTLATYNSAPDAYIENSPQKVEGYLQQWIDAVFTGIPKNTAILEIGSGGGRDAVYIENELGFTNVLRSDASPEFVERLRDEGHDAALVDALQPIGSKEQFGVVFADAVLLHFDDEELPVVLGNIYECLENGGELYFTTAKPAAGQKAAGWSDRKLGSERYFNRLDEQSLRAALANAGFSATDTVVQSDTSDKWFHVATRKVAV